LKNMIVDYTYLLYLFGNSITPVIFFLLPI